MTSERRGTCGCQRKGRRCPRIDERTSKAPGGWVVTPADQRAFLGVLAKCCVIYGRETGELLGAAWWERMQTVEFEDFEAVMERWMDTETWMPTPAEIRERCGFRAISQGRRPPAIGKSGVAKLPAEIEKRIGKIGRPPA